MMRVNKEYIKLFRFKLLWRKRNRHNFTGAKNVFNENNAAVGKYTYGRIKILNERSDVKLYIGSFSSIAEEVTFILGNDHCIDRLSTYPFRHMLINSDAVDAMTKGDIIVEDDVWIGYGATILSGVHIHQGAIIAAGAVVTHEIPPYAIAGGVPARIIKYRFSPAVIDYMLTLDYGKLEDSTVKEHIDDLYRPVNVMTLDEIKNLYSWFPKKE